MLWEKLKKDIADFVEANPAHEGSLYLEIQAGDGPVSAYLDTMDIRNVDKLRSLVREAFPKSLQRGTLQLDLTDKGWTVTRK